MRRKIAAQQFGIAAAANGAEVLILGAFGCGAFRNAPAVVTAAYQQVLPQSLNHLKTIEFAVYCRLRDSRNYDVFTTIRNTPTFSC